MGRDRIYSGKWKEMKRDATGVAGRWFLARGFFSTTAGWRWMWFLEALAFAREMEGGDRRVDLLFACLAFVSWIRPRGGGGGGIEG